jgi:hypothetical protein
MEKYIGCKIIKAEEMDECTFLKEFKGEDVSNRETQPGYHVEYPDGYNSWSPKKVFEAAYRKFTDGEIDMIYGHRALVPGIQVRVLIGQQPKIEI